MQFDSDQQIDCSSFLFCRFVPQTVQSQVASQDRIIITSQDFVIWCVPLDDMKMFSVRCFAILLSCVKG